MAAGNGETYDILSKTKTVRTFFVQTCASGENTPYAFKDAEGFDRCSVEGACSYQADIGEKLALCIKGYDRAVKGALRRTFAAAQPLRAEDANTEYMGDAGNGD